MTDLPSETDKKLGLLIDLDICVGCHGCVTSCKEWNSTDDSLPLSDFDSYGELQMGYFSIGSMDMKLKMAFQVKQCISHVLVYIVSSQNVSLFVQPVLAIKGKKMALF